ncbi:hypothetical protein VZ17_005058 [Salmonella enterica subsp. enterica serovar Abaetetuba]|nr:hypothetical protein [Salmonella enterica subsp. enterica serovar Abaetetuba]
MVCCRFYLTAAPFAANPSGAVRPTDVMVNRPHRRRCGCQVKESSGSRPSARAASRFLSAVRSSRIALSTRARIRRFIFGQFLVFHVLSVSFRLPLILPCQP